jgi:large subunit ribosomal protein L18
MASKVKKLVLRRERIKAGIRKKINGTATKPRLSVFRSNTAVYAQLIDDLAGKTLVGFGASSTVLKKSKTEVAQMVGKSIAEKAKSIGIEEVVFDRNGYLYHGRVKALAEAAREGGLKF